MNGMDCLVNTPGINIPKEEEDIFIRRSQYKPKTLASNKKMISLGI